MKQLIVGTAGHIDHGKTSLIEALTGYNGDSTKEEKARGITIDLSFSNLRDNNTNISFIDVPGHEKLLKTMIAGAFGFDAALVVIDTNEGIMPQTKEHLEILNLLNVKNIVITLTKTDLATQEQIEKREAQIKEYLQNFENFETIKITHFSIYSQESIENLKEILFNLPKQEHKGSGLFRYYIDRSFSIAGAGSVVTGTVLDGEVKVKDKLIVAQSSKEVIVRNIQVHGKDEDVAKVSYRAALNLQTKQKLKKGDLLTKKGFLRGFNTIDVYIQSIGSKLLKHNSTVVFHIGTLQLEAKMLLFNAQEEVKSGFATLKFKEKVYTVFNEPFIITQSGRVLGGGRVLNPINEPIKKRLKLPLLKTLKEKDFKKSFEILVNFHKKGFGLISSFQRFSLNHQEALEIIKSIDNLFVDEKELVAYPIEIKSLLKKRIKEIFEKNQYALLSAKSLKLKIVWASQSLLELILKELEDEGVLEYANGIYKNKNIVIDNIDLLIEDKIYSILTNGNITPEAPYNIYDSLDIDRAMGDNALKKLTKSKKVIRLAHNLFVTFENLQKLVKELKEIIKKDGYLEISNFKKHYPNLSRKYIIAYLEYLDKQSGIKKDGNRRYLFSS